eukprot:Opistho-2@68769
MGLPDELTQLLKMPHRCSHIARCFGPHNMLHASAIVLAVCALVLQSLVVFADPIPKNERIQVHPTSRQFVGMDGRTRLFHGLALQTTTSDISTMTDAQMDAMIDMGHNVVRIAFHWHLVETAPGVYNQTYVDALATLVDRFAEKGIFAILDMHQDNWSPMYSALI